jgi:hypothetical protein
MPSSESEFGQLRRIVAALVAFGLIAIAVELVLIEHVENTSQLIPVIVLPLAALLLGPIAFGAVPWNVVALRGVLAIVVLAGIAGVGLHVFESWQFQAEVDPSQPGVARAWAALRAQSPPSLAPGQIALLGLLGLAAATGPAPTHPSPPKKEPTT